MGTGTWWGGDLQEVSLGHRERQGQGCQRARQPVKQTLWASRTLESSQEQGTIPVPGWSTKGATTSHFNQGVPACPLCFIPSSSAPKL